AMLPIFGVYLLTAVKKWQKAIIALLIPFCLNLIILSNSRATMVALLAIGLLSVFLVKGKFKFAVLIGLVVGGATFLHLTNDDFHERQHAETYSDNSASSRLWLWRGAFEMWKDHPMGVGGGGFVDLSMSYIPEIDKPKSQHNTFVAAFSDWGFIGIFLYLALLTHCLRITMTVKRWSKWYPELHKYHLETTAVQLALIGLAIAGMFHSLQYSEVTFWLYAFAVIQKNLICEEIIEIENGDYSETESVYKTETALSPVSQPVS
ncbi:MAG: O-antigen ligase family protein, partial [Calditrichaeota bacterium]|nr:O-antigen ligase family protein [Calditrichota bacterium]